MTKTIDADLVDIWRHGEAHAAQHLNAFGNSIDERVLLAEVLVAEHVVPLPLTHAV